MGRTKNILRYGGKMKKDRILQKIVNRNIGIGLLIGMDLCQYFGQKFRFFCESPPPLTIRTEMLAGYHPKAKNSKQAIHIAFVRLNCSISLSNNQGQAPLGRLASP